MLYPSDATPAGQELRLRQEYFFTSASLQDIVRRHLQQFDNLDSLPEHVAIQLNDTHPAIAVAELMRILVDEHDCSWKHAWRITKMTLSYTNHTLLPEALESWPVSLLNRLLPRHMQIIYMINKLHLEEAVGNGLADLETLASISLIQEGHDKRVRMGHLAFVGSHKINGVSELHTDLMGRTVFRDLNRALPGRIVNMTNGISFRRWLFEANPQLTALLTRTLGEGVLDDPSELKSLERLAEDLGFAQQYAATRQRNKESIGAPHPRPDRGRGRSGRDVRRADQAHSRIQAPASQHPRNHCTLPVHSPGAEPGMDASRQDFRRQGGGELRARQADHQARQ